MDIQQAQNYQSLSKNNVNLRLHACAAVHEWSAWWTENKSHADLAVYTMDCMHNGRRMKEASQDTIKFTVQLLASTGSGECFSTTVCGLPQRMFSTAGNTSLPHRARAPLHPYKRKSSLTRSIFGNHHSFSLILAR